MLKIQSAGGEEPLEYLWTRAGEEGGAAHGRQQAGLQRQSTVESIQQQIETGFLEEFFKAQFTTENFEKKNFLDVSFKKYEIVKPNGTKIQFFIGSLSILP